MRSLEYAKLAKDAALLKWSSSERAKRHRRESIADRMGKLHGLPQKVGQVMSFGGDEDWDSPFGALQESSEAMPWEAVQQAIAASGRLGDGVTIDLDAKAASLGQVHRGKLPDGADVAIKVRYPGVVESVRTDIKHLHTLSMPFGSLKRGFNFRAYQDMFGAQLEQELDYGQEADNQQRFYDLWFREPQVVVPKVYRDRCCESVLVTSWEDGDHHHDVVRDWSGQQKRQLGELLVRFFFTGLLKHGRMQADWHPGNLRFRREPSQIQLVVYDFGCLCELTEPERNAVSGLIGATRRGEPNLLPFFLQLGFCREMLEPIAEKLPALCRVFFEPLRVSGEFDVSKWRLSERVGEVLGEDRWNFRFAAPPRLLLLMRAFHGLFYYLRTWNAPIDWNRCVDNDLFETSIVVKAPRASTSRSARLKIRVTENGIAKVQLTQPATVLQRLDEVLEPAIQAKLAEQNVDLDRIAADAEIAGYAPGEIFNVDYGRRSVRVWLE